MNYTSIFCRLRIVNVQLRHTVVCNISCDIVTLRNSNFTFRYNVFYTVGNARLCRIITMHLCRLFVSFKSSSKLIPEHVLSVRNRLIDFSMSLRFCSQLSSCSFDWEKKKVVFKSTKTVASNEMLMLENTWQINYKCRKVKWRTENRIQLIPFFNDWIWSFHNRL